MKAFIEYLIKEIASKPEEIRVIESNQDGIFTYLIHAAPEDMGTLIGREGHTIKSIRDLVRAKAIKDNVRVRVNIEDQNPQGQEEYFGENQPNSDEIQEETPQDTPEL